YVSGPGGATFGPNSVPIPNVKVYLDEPTGKTQTTTTASDGSYQFSLPVPGFYAVSTEQQDPAQANVPGRHVLRFNTAQPNLQNLRGMLTTPEGDPLYQVGYTNQDFSSPVTVSADFFGDGGWDTATLGWSPNNSGLYLVIIKGGDS